MSKPEAGEPSEPPPSAQETQRLPAGEPADPRATQHIDLSTIQAANQALKATRPPQSAPVGPPKAPSRSGSEHPPIRIQRVDQPVEAVGQVLEVPPAVPEPSSRKWLAPLILGGLVAVGASAFIMLAKDKPPRSPVGAAQQASATFDDLQGCLQRAESGDAHAMRMLGVMYYYGLNVPQDREKGLHWYRKAAEQGSETARAELSKLQAAK